MNIYLYKVLYRPEVSMSFNERRFLMIKITTYLLTLKIVSEVVIVDIYATSAFTKTFD